MKAFTAGMALVGLLLVAACSSGNPSARNDYKDSAFTTPAAKRAAREAEIRKLYPTLTEKQIEQKLDGEFPPGAAR